MQKIKRKIIKFAQTLTSLKSGHYIVISVATLVAFVVVTGSWAVLIAQPGNLQTEQVVRIEKGSSARAVSKKLSEAGVIDSPFWFRLNARLMFAHNQLQAGVYRFEPYVSQRDVIKMLARGNVATYNVTFSEGLTVEEILKILEKEENLSGDFPPMMIEKVEGYFLPETYQYIDGEKRSDILKRMRRDMEDVLDDAWKNRDKTLPLESKRDLLTLASIVEKETAVDEEKPLVAGVYINRLNKNMRLQSDPTVIYGASNYNGDITRKHLKENHPYNTYVHKGLPQGPICNPGKVSILAVANPQTTDAFYFVADGKGGHVFAKTLEEHNKNVQAYLKFYREMVK